MILLNKKFQKVIKENLKVKRGKKDMGYKKRIKEEKTLQIEWQKQIVNFLKNEHQN